MFIDLILALNVCGLVGNLACFRMRRTRMRRTDRGTSQAVLEVAGAEVTNSGGSVRSVATEYGICHVSLHRFRVRLRKTAYYCV